jgi:hypothetical protein
MRILKNILHLTIVLALLTAGFPMLKGDVNLDERLDLADAVLSVRGLVRSVDSPAMFEKNIENALISLAAAAGVQKVMKADNSAAVSQFSCIDSPYLISAFDFIAPVTAVREQERYVSLYRSIEISPSPHPPRLLL